MNIIILGCGRTGSTLATSLGNDGHKVSIIDRSTDAFRRLGADFSGNKIVGNGTDEAVLKRAGIETANAFVAVTNGDNTNIMAAQIAKEKFGVSKVLARIYDPIRAEAYAKMGIGTFCSTVVGAGIIKDLITDQPVKSYAEYTLLMGELGH